MTQARATRQLESERVRVTEWRFAPGEATGLHTHPVDYVVVPITGGLFEVHEPDGSVREMRQEPGLSYARAAGTTHDLVSTGEGEAVFVEVELL